MATAYLAMSTKTRFDGSPSIKARRAVQRRAKLYCGFFVSVALGFVYTRARELRQNPQLLRLLGGRRTSCAPSRRPSHQPTAWGLSAQKLTNDDFMQEQFA